LHSGAFILALAISHTIKYPLSAEFLYKFRNYISIVINCFIGELFGVLFFIKNIIKGGIINGSSIKSKS